MFYKSVTISACCITMFCAGFASAQDTSRPNILVIWGG